MDWKEVGLEILKIALPAALAGGSVGGFIGASKAARKLERRLYQNSQRPVFMFAAGSDLAVEAKLLTESAFMKPDGPYNDLRFFEHLGNAGLVVISYADTDSFWAAFQKAQDKSLPVIVYAAHGAIPPEHLARLSKYLRFTTCNSPLRLASDVFAILSIFPEKS